MFLVVVYLDESLDGLALWSDDSAEGIAGHGELQDPWYLRWEITCLCQMREHLRKDVSSSALRLVQCHTQCRQRQSIAFDIELEGRNPLRIASDLEIHRAECVLETEDVGEDHRVLVGI